MDRIESHAFLIVFALLLAAIALFMNGAALHDSSALGLPTRSVAR